MMTDIWQDFLTIIREEVGSRVVETWFKSITLVNWDSASHTIHLRAPNQFITDWVSTHYQHLFYTHLSRLLGEKNIRVIFDQGNKDTASPSIQPATRDVSVTRPLFSPAKQLPYATPAKKGRPCLNTAYLFETFIVGPSNSLAYAAARAVAEKPGKLYNPFFIYGGSGLGKTHLLHAIGQKIKEDNPKCSVLYQTADHFVKDFISAIRFEKIFDFEKKYQNIDVLLIDDIQSISNKEQTQEAFFHIFNAMHQAQKQIVFTSDSLPRDIEGLADRIRSRLEWGLVADISIPHLETKVAIIKKKAELLSKPLTDEIAYAIAQRPVHNIRELEGMLLRLIATVSLSNEDISQELIEKLFPHTAISQPSPADHTTLEEIIDAVAKACEVSVSSLRSTSRAQHIAHARHIALYMMRKKSSASLREIGASLQRKDHTTVLHAYHKIEELIDSDPIVAHHIKTIEKMLQKNESRFL